MTTTSARPSTDLAGLLRSAGVQIKSAGEREITGKCPVHVRVTGREDRSPSWSINADSGLWICFSCGARGTLSMLMAELLGTDSMWDVQTFIIQNTLNRLNAPNHVQIEPPVDIDEFTRFERVSDKKCQSKNLDPDLVYQYGVRWNPKNKSWAIPIISSSAELKGWQEKKSGWVRNFPIGVEKSKTLFGIERFRAKTAVLVESPLDVVRFAAVFSAPQCLASFGAHVSDAQLDMLSHSADKVIIAMDNDEAGLLASQKIYKRLPHLRRGVWWWNYDGTDAKDIGDMTDEEIDRGLRTATSLPPWTIRV